MALLEWNSNFATDIREIDSQHKELFELVNKIEEKLSKSENIDIVNEALDKLIDYTIYHFQQEEELLENKRYPKLSEHKLQHENLTHNVLEFRKEIRMNSEINYMEFLEFLSNWLKKHTTSADIEYAEFLKRNKLV